MANPRESQRVSLGDLPRPTPAKATLAVTPSHTALTDVVSTVIKAKTSSKAAAIDMGIDRAQLYRQLQSGHLTLARLEALGPDVLAELGKRLVDAYGALASSPASRVRLKAKELRALADELEQLADYITEVA